MILLLENTVLIDFEILLYLMETLVYLKFKSETLNCSFIFFVSLPKKKTVEVKIKLSSS